MEEAVFKGIADEIKGLCNQAVRMIGQGNFCEAEAFCQRALAITQTISYYDGMALVLFNLANLEAIRGDLLKAITYGALCQEIHGKAGTDSALCDELLGNLAKSAMKKGMEYEKNGELREALEYYYACVPFSLEKYRLAILKEIEIVERLMSNE